MRLRVDPAVLIILQNQQSALVNTRQEKEEKK
jgi:hypothetical protein